jgi:hypothetical protein
MTQGGVDRICADFTVLCFRLSWCKLEVMLYHVITLANKRPECFPSVIAPETADKVSKA